MRWTPERIQELKQIVDANTDLRDIVLAMLMASRGTHGGSGTLDEMRYRAVEVLGLPSHRPQPIEVSRAVVMVEKETR